MFFLHDIPLYAKYTAIYCSQSVFIKSILSGCFQHSKPPMIERFYSKKHIIWKKNGLLIISAKVYQIYSDILELEHFFKEHPIRLFSACKPTLNSEFSKQKSHHMKKKKFFIMDQYTTNILWCIATGPKEHLFWLFSACKSHASTIHTKLFMKIGFFNDVPIYTKYTAIH